jgi:hypothetical protein
MTLPEAVLNFLTENARQANVAQPKADDNLFKRRFCKFCVSEFWLSSAKTED